MNRAKEFQRGTAGVLESAKEGVTGLSEGSDIGLGEHFQTFESHTPDQTPPSRAKKRYKADKTDGFLVSCFHQYLQSQTRKHPKDDRNLCLDIFDHKLLTVCLLRNGQKFASNIRVFKAKHIRIFSTKSQKIHTAVPHNAFVNNCIFVCSMRTTMRGIYPKY
mgnify:CR=1 FL=1